MVFYSIFFSYLFSPRHACGNNRQRFLIFIFCLLLLSGLPTTRCREIWSYAHTAEQILTIHNMYIVYRGKYLRRKVMWRRRTKRKHFKVVKAFHASLNLYTNWKSGMTMTRFSLPSIVCGWRCVIKYHLCWWKNALFLLVYKWWHYSNEMGGQKSYIWRQIYQYNIIPRVCVCKAGYVASSAPYQLKSDYQKTLESTSAIVASALN